MKSRDLDEFIAFLRENERWLMKRTMKYAKAQEYTKYTSTLLEAWRISIVGLTDSLALMMQNSTDIPELTPDEHYDDDPACAFGVKEARLHRSRGVNLAMFFTLFKYYRQSYLELLVESYPDSSHLEYLLAYTNRFFDRVESAYIIEWSGRDAEEQIHELAEMNRRQANEKNRYLTIFDSIDSASMVISTTGVIENYNLRAGKLFFQDEKIGRYYYSEPKRLHLKEVYPKLYTYLQSDDEEPLQWRHDKKVYSVTIKSLHDISKKNEGWVLLFSDITEIEASERYFRQLYEDAPIAYQSLDKDGVLVRVNKKWLEELGYKNEEVIGRRFEEFLIADHRLRSTKSFSSFIEAGHINGIEYEMICKDGEHIIVVFSGKNVTDDPEMVFRTHCVFTNITSQKQLEKRLLYEEQYLSAIFEAVPNIMMTTDGEDIDRANENMLRLLGYPSLDMFKEEHRCICELFVKEEGYLQKQMGDLTWIEHVVQNPTIVHKAKITLDDKDRTYVVSVSVLLLDKRSRYITTLTDVTEIELILERHEYAMVGANDGIWDWDIPKNTIYFSPRWRSMLGLDEKTIGNTFAEFEALVHPDDMVNIMQKVRAHLEGGVPYVTMMRMRHRDGRWLWILARGKVVEWTMDGIPLRMVGTHTDITEVKEKEAKIEELRTLLKNILDSVENLIFVKDKDFRYIECNPAFERFMGRTREELIGKSDYEFFDKEVADFFRGKDKEMFSEGNTRSNFEWVTYPDGHEVYLLTVKAPLRDDKEEIIGLVGNSVDLTEQYRDQQEIAKFKQILEKSPVSIIITDVEGNIEYVNPWFTHVSGYSPEEAIGKTPRILKCDRHPESDYQELWNEITHDRVWSGTFLNIKKSGEEFWEAAIIVPVFDDEGQIVNYIGIQQEITEQVQLREELKDQEKIMIAQSRHAAMGEMVSMIAHQWRQPITVISMGANNILADIDLNQIDAEEFKVQARGILNQTQHLSKTIDDFRDFFRPDKEIEEVRVKDVLEEAYKIIGKSLEHSAVTYHVSHESVQTIKTYSRELLQVYINLLKNAKEALVDHREDERKIEVSIRDEDDLVITKVCDNGSGIEEAIIDRVFEPYFSTKDAQTGTGLGLYMSKTIVEKHLHGKIEVKNTQDGVCFIISLPLVWRSDR